MILIAVLKGYLLFIYYKCFSFIILCAFIIEYIFFPNIVIFFYLNIYNDYILDNSYYNGPIKRESDSKALRIG